MPTPASLNALPAAIRQHLDDDLTVTVSTSLRLNRHDAAPDVTFYNASIWWEYTLGSSPADDDARATAWAATHDMAPDGFGQLNVPVGRVSLSTISRTADNAGDQLDSISGGYDTLGAALFDEGKDGRPYADTLQGFGGLALLLDDIEIAEPFRGHKIGIAVLDRLLTHFEESCGCALLSPEDRTAPDDVAAARARAGLARYWSTLGFQEVGHGVLGIDLGLVRPFHPGRGLRSV